MIYILEDDDSIRELVVYTLNSLGYSAEGFSLPSKFWGKMKIKLPKIILLDIMLPEEDGLEILKKLKSNSLYSSVPVIMLTAKSTEYDKVKGLDSGADDYIPKPFGMMELSARIRAIMRRTSTENNDSREMLSSGKLTVSLSSHKVTANGKNIILTLKEFELLCLLLKNKNIVFSRNKILDKIWGYSFDGESRTVDVHIRTLRQKLGECGNCIETVRGVGYRIGEE